MENLYPSSCALCPRECKADRRSGAIGFCKAGNKAKIARAALHFWEEPCISGKNGSGTVFFSHCTLKCAYCQNHELSRVGVGMELSDDALAEEYLRLQSEGAENINLVTPTHYLPSVIASLKKAKSQGLTIPIVYNCGGYEKAETIRLLDGLADVYLPDMKYCSDKYAAKYSSAPGYFDTAKKALAEMVRQCPKAVFNGEGLMQKGVIVRHLMLPGLLFDTKKIIDYIYREYGNSIWISLMNQYTPMGNICKFAELNRPLPKRAYEDMIDYCAELGMENVFIQEEGTVSESFIPPFSNCITRR